MADLAGHRRLGRARCGPPLQRLGLIALLCSLLLEQPAHYVFFSPAPPLGGRRRGLALVAERARGAIVAARCVVEDAERSFTVVTNGHASPLRQRPCAKKTQLCLGGIVEGLGAASRALSVQRRRIFSMEVGELSRDVPESWTFFTAF